MSENSESFASLYPEYEDSQEMQKGELIAAEIVAIDDKSVTVNAGLKSEAFIDRKEFLDAKGELEVQVGDMTTVVIENVENGYGQTVLSREKAKRAADWRVLEVAMAENQVLHGVISGKVKGGMTVMINSIRAFLPGSLIDVRTVKDTAPYEGKEIEFKVIKLDKKRNNVVVSRRAVLEESLSEEREALLESLHEGAIVNGVVKNITDYGAFVDLGGIDGLLHITDIAWRRVKHPSDVLSVGQELETKVLKFDRETGRVSLGLKQLGEDPWNSLSKRYPPGTKIMGKVTNMTEYGAFVEVEQGIEGLVHVSEMDWTNKNIHPSKVVSVGQEVQVMILSIDEDKRRISLGMKQCMPNPWEEFAINYAPGSVIKSAVKSVTDFGLFVGLPGGIDGLVYLTDITWGDNAEEMLQKYKKGDEVEVKVLSVNTEKDRISLGIKQLSEDPFNKFLSEHEKGTVVTGTVSELDPKGAIVVLADGVNGYLRVSDVAMERVEDINSVLKEGQEVEALISAVDRKTKSIGLSIKAKLRKEQSDALRANAEKNAIQGNATLGDLLKDQLRDSSR